MARAVYVESITYMAVDGTLKAAENIEVTIFNVNSDGSRGGQATGKLWGGRTGATPHAAQFLTPANGFVQVWADEGDYDITFHDTLATPRIADFAIGWSAVSGLKTAQAIGFEVGDVKLSSLAADHGRWLKMDGRTLTQSDIEGALSLGAGEAAAIVAHLGTGAASKYGVAPAGKIKLADTRRSMPMLAGPTGDGPGGLTVRPLTSVGGVETVTLSAAQSGTPAHTHTAAQAAHTHGGTTGASGAHSHGAATGLDGAHNHGGATGNDTDHFHAFTGNVNTLTTQTGNTNRVASFNDSSTVTQAAASGTGPGSKGLTSKGLPHTHNIPGAPDHTHPITAAPDHTHTIASVTPAITIDAITAAAASASHDNMPPFVTIGFAFIRA